jgi:hypothetical protein
MSSWGVAVVFEWTGIKLSYHWDGFRLKRPGTNIIVLVYCLIGHVSIDCLSAQLPDDDPFLATTLKPKDSGYRGIWFTLGQFSDRPFGKNGQGKDYWDYGDKYSGGLATYTAKHVPIAIHAAEVNKTFFCFGGARDGERYLYNMVSYFDHETGHVPRPTVVHDKRGVSDPHDNAAMTIDSRGHLWIYISGRGRHRPGFVYKSVKPYEIEQFQFVSSGEICYPQPWSIGSDDILELFTKYTGVRELYWNVRKLDGTRGQDKKLAGIEGHYQVSFRQGRRVVTAFNRHLEGHPDHRTDLYFLQTNDLGQSWQTVTGATIETPLIDPINDALVKSYSLADRYVYLNDVTLDENGNPIILIVTSAGSKPGPEGDPRTWEVLHFVDGHWQIHPVTRSTHNYDTGPIWARGREWQIVGPTESGPQRWGGGGELARWVSSDQGRNWQKTNAVTLDSPRNHSYVRKVINAPPDSPFYFLWADGHADKHSISKLYFADRLGRVVRELPYEMETEFAAPTIVTRPKRSN